MRIRKDLYAYRTGGAVNKSVTARNVLRETPNASPRALAAKLDMHVSEIYVARKELGLSKKYKPRKETAPIHLPVFDIITKGKTLDEAYDNVTKSDDLLYDDMGYSPHANVVKTAVEHDPVNHPSHYTVGGIETIDFIEAKQLNYNLGNVVKYLTRSEHKGNKKQDLQKALWYLNRELQNTK